MIAPILVQEQTKSVKDNYPMKTILLVKEIYLEAFKNLGSFIVRNYFRAFAWFSFAMFLVVLYAFVFRVYTGFPFD